MMAGFVAGLVLGRIQIHLDEHMATSAANQAPGEDETCRMMGLVLGSVEIDFARGVVSMVRHKLQHDCGRLVRMARDDAAGPSGLIAHLVNESVRFDKTVRGLTGVAIAGVVDGLAEHEGMRAAWEQMEIDASRQAVRELSLLTTAFNDSPMPPAMDTIP